MRNKPAMVLWLSITLIMFFGMNPMRVPAKQKGAQDATSNSPVTVTRVSDTSTATSEKPLATGKSPAPGVSDAADPKSQPKTDTADGVSKPTSSVASEADRIRALEDALQRQNDKLIQMQKLIEEQQRMMQLLNAKTPGGTGAEPRVEASANVSSPAGNSTPSKDVTERAEATTQQNPPSLEDRLKKVEERVIKIGPVRVGGDFRFRLDGIFRPATEPPDPALQHVQNVRMRYRFRLNLDTDVSKAISFHGQLTTGPINNGLTQDQDFTSTVAHQPLFISEAYMDFHPNKNVQLQGGRVPEVFADNSRFLFDDDVRFNGFNEKFVFPLGEKGASSIELRAAQYWFSNPNVAVITAGSPLAVAGDEIGTIGRSSNLFHQGLLVNLKVGEVWTHQFGGDVQVFREPNQIQLASTANGVVFIVQPGLGLVLSGPMTGTGNATTTAGGAIYTAEDFHIGRLTYRLSHTGFKVGEHAYPITFNAQVARNFGTEANERDAMLAAFQVGRPTKLGDMSFLYVLSIKGANSIISQLTDDDLGTGTGVNLRTHYVRWELGLARNITLQSLVFRQRELRNSGQFPNFFVPLNAFTPTQYRFQEHLVFTF
ncbi:MAG TPA: putative porin [Blastocatellia bacterium]|nr:putative porin [Blastocatellia bacterium]